MSARSRFVSLAVVLAAGLGLAPRAEAANDPNIVWQTIETPHFRIHFPSQGRPVAERVADLAEDIHARLAPAVGWQPSEVTELLLADQTDSANGSATALPYNAVRLNITAPDDMSPLGDAEDWYLELVTHEYTHILHTDHITGIPAIANALLGKTYAPNQVQPRWALEGLAVFEESQRTSGGRLRSAIWNMYMRGDVMENNVAELDEFSNSVRRWPQGNLWYLYGSFFMRWIAETYGEEAIRKMIDDYSRQIIPYAFNRSVRRATGRTFEELYPAWIATLRRVYGAQVDAVRARGIRQGVRITKAGQNARHPRWIPKGAWPGHEGDLLYFRDDGHSTAGMYAVPVSRDPTSGQITGAREVDRELLIRVSGESTVSFTPDGGAVWDSLDQFQNLFYFNDLFRAPPNTRSPRGLEGRTKRLTEGFRAIEPDVSPDGRKVAFTSNHRGTTYLQIARLTEDGVEDVKNIVPGKPFDQAYTPRWAPDGRHLAYSAWSHGGYRDVRVVDTTDGSFIEIAHDRAQDGGPSWSPDGKYVFFHSDRTGIDNVYAWDVETHRLRQVTNVTTGAFQPEVSADGKTLAYVGYTHNGFDLFAMPLDEKQWLDALPYVDDRPATTPEPPHHAWKVRPYSPLSTLAPHKYGVAIGQGNFGNQATVTIGGSDIVGHHSYAASLTSEFEKPELQGSFTYVYSRLPVDLSVSAYRSIAPRGGFALGGARPTWISETTGVETGVGYTMPRQFDSQSFSLSYSAARTAGDFGTTSASFNPYETPQFPARGLVSFVHMGWAYSNAERYLWSVANERGFGANANLELTDPALGSEYKGFSTSANMEWFYTMPWLSHHSLALHTGAGTSGGNYPGRGAYYIGGFVDLPVIDSVRNTLIQGGIVLRGYPTVAEAGRSYALMNAEYRFPIWNIDRGPSTLPFFLNRVSGTVFVDYGSAFDDAYVAKFKTGTGAELWNDFTIGYIQSFTFRLGYARGLASGGVDKTYFVATIPY